MCDCAQQLSGCSHKIEDCGATGTVTAVTGTAPVTSTGGTAPAIGVPAFAGTTSGLVPTGPNDATKFLNGAGAFTVPVGTTLPALIGTSGAIGGGLLTVGQTAKGTAAVTGARTGMAVAVTPSTYPGDGTDWAGYVSSNDVVTVVVTAFVTVTPTSSVYNCRVIQ